MNKFEMAKALANTHYALSRDITRVDYYDIPDSIGLLVVNKKAPGLSLVRLEPFGEFTLGESLLEMTPRQYQMAMRGSIKLPQGWRNGRHIPPDERIRGMLSGVNPAKLLEIASQPLKELVI